jgi:hypothetical protein
MPRSGGIDAIVALIAGTAPAFELDIAARRVVTDFLTISNARLAASLDDGTLTVESLSGQALGSAFGLEARLAARADPIAGWISASVDSLEVLDIA